MLDCGVSMLLIDLAHSSFARSCDRIREPVKVRPGLTVPVFSIPDSDCFALGPACCEAVHYAREHQEASCYTMWPLERDWPSISTLKVMSL